MADKKFIDLDILAHYNTKILEKVDSKITSSLSNYLTTNGTASNSSKLNNQNAGYYLDYNNFTNKPTIPTVNNATLTIQKNGTSVGTFTSNASSNATINITVPTGAAADKGVVTAIDTSANLPTSNAVKTFVEGKGYLTGITSSLITSALGYTPYDSANPNGYITSSSSITGNAATATMATQDGSGNVITSTYAKLTDVPKLGTTNWTVSQDSSGNLLFKYGGATKLRLSSAGQLDVITLNLVDGL